LKSVFVKYAAIFVNICEERSKLLTAKILFAIIKPEIILKIVREGGAPKASLNL